MLGLAKWRRQNEPYPTSRAANHLPHPLHTRALKAVVPVDTVTAVFTTLSASDHSVPRLSALIPQVSDVCGVCFGGTVEAFATKMGLPSPDLTMRQRGLRVSRLAATFGAASGVVFGCILGMGTLLFMDTTHAEREKKQVLYGIPYSSM